METQPYKRGDRMDNEKTLNQEKIMAMLKCIKEIIHIGSLFQLNKLLLRM